MRYEDWPRRLQTLINEARDQDFDWGRWDCCQFAGLVVEALTGTNPVAHLRGRYRTRIGAARVLRREFGTAAIPDALTQVLGPSVPPLCAGRGDIVAVPVDDQPALGVVDLSGERVAALGLHGLEHVPLTAATAAWKV